LPASATPSIVLTIGELADLLFCTGLQPSEAPNDATVRRAVSRRLSETGDPVRRSAEDVAAGYGDDPDLALQRMRWALSLVVSAYLIPRVQANCPRSEERIARDDASVSHAHVRGSEDVNLRW
jgi:hypothetical protein